MMDKKVYMKPNVVAEPLFKQWYACHLLFPGDFRLVHRQVAFEDQAILRLRSANSRGGAQEPGHQGWAICQPRW